jgi:hypothetical protein
VITRETFNYTAGQYITELSLTGDRGFIEMELYALLHDVANGYSDDLESISYSGKIHPAFQRYSGLADITNLHYSLWA